MPVNYSGSVSLPEQVRAWGAQRQGAPYSGDPSMPISAIPTPTNLGDLATLGTNINAQNRAAQTAALRARIPRATQLENQSSANIMSELEGKLPQDVMDLLGQQGAEGATATGGNPEAAYLKGLGLTSLDLTQRGQGDLSAAYARNPAAPIFDPTSQLLTPAQAGQLAISGGQLRLSAQEAADQIALEQERLALQGSGRASTATPARTASVDAGFPAFNYAPADSQGIQQPFTTSDWLASIGYGTGPAAPSTEFDPNVITDTGTAA